jgi:hypothetical protein
MVRSKFVFSAALTFLAASFANAADEWLSADHLQLASGDKLTLHLNVGVELAATAERAFNAKENERFDLYHGNDYMNLIEGTQDGVKPFWSQPLDFESEFLVVLTRAQQSVERQRVWTFAKLLGRVGADDEGSLHHRFVGQQLEMVLIQNPVLLKAGDEEIVQLYFETKAAAGQSITARHRENGKLSEVTAITDARGVARLRFDAAGVWVLGTTYVRACKACKDADTESFHASYAFELGT